MRRWGYWISCFWAGLFALSAHSSSTPSCHEQGQNRYQLHLSKVQSGKWSLPNSAHFDVTTQVRFYSTRDGQILPYKIYSPIDERHAHKLVIQIHGGGWIGGSYLDMEPWARAISSWGFVVVSPEYRFAPKWIYPTQIHDVTDAIKEVIGQKNASELKLDLSDGFSAFGFSAGSNLAAYLVGLESSGRLDLSIHLTSAILMSTRSDLTLTDSGTDYTPTYLGRPRGGDSISLYQEASPLYALKAVAPIPQTLLVHQLGDAVIPWTQSCLFFEKSNDLSAPKPTSRILLLPDAGHGPTGISKNVALSAFNSFLVPDLNDHLLRKTLVHPGDWQE